MKKVYYKKKKPSQAKKNIKKIKSVSKKHLKPALEWKNLIHHTARYLVVFLAVLAIFSVAQAVLMYSRYQEYKKVHDDVVRDFEYWEGVISEHPNVPDGYYNAAIYAGMLGDKEKAMEYVKKALFLDPDFSEAKELEVKLTSI